MPIGLHDFGQPSGREGSFIEPGQRFSMESFLLTMGLVVGLLMSLFSRDSTFLSLSSRCFILHGRKDKNRREEIVEGDEGSLQESPGSDGAHFRSAS